MKTTKSKANGTPSTVDWKEVNKVLDFMNLNGLEEFEFAQGDLHLKLRKPGSLPVALAPAAQGPVAATSGVPTQAAHPESRADNLHVVKSPIVGTFYASPNPQAEAYVKVGDKVEAGQVLCIIEAMKLMNEIESDASGEVVKILATNAQPVEYGEGLFALRVDKT
jgi:acetyl-CoA carboxylase biotin carboxyl carrier protein